MATAARILDTTRFEARARIADILAVGLLVVVGFSLMVEMYYIGRLTSAAVADATMIVARDARFVRAMIQVALMLGSLGWIAYRLFSGGARRVG